MLNLQETITLNNLETSLENAHTIGCECNGMDCSICPFHYDGDNGGGYSCVIAKMQYYLNCIKEENNA